MSVLDERLISAKQLALLLDVSRDTVEAHCKPGAPDYWEHHRIGRQIKFTAAQVEAILADSLMPAQMPGGRAAPVVDMAAVMRGLERTRPRTRAPKTRTA